jgi:hypothetical protein
MGTSDVEGMMMRTSTPWSAAVRSAVEIASLGMKYGVTIQMRCSAWVKRTK